MIASSHKLYLFYQTNANQNKGAVIKTANMGTKARSSNQLVNLYLLYAFKCQKIDSYY
jgi:hypothetical protein